DPGADEPHHAGEPRRAVEPDRHDAQDHNPSDDQADPLFRPELEARAAARADELLQDLAQNPCDDPGDEDESDGQQQLVEVVLGSADQGHTEYPRSFDVTRVARRRLGAVPEEIGQTLHGRLNRNSAEWVPARKLPKLTVLRARTCAR